jgi:hypothetical protein
MGDFRTMIRAENPNKIRNIVALQLDEFEKLYLPLMINLSDGSNLILSRSTADVWEVHIFSIANLNSKRRIQIQEQWESSNRCQRNSRVSW